MKCIEVNIISFKKFLFRFPRDDVTFVHRQIQSSNQDLDTLAFAYELRYKSFFVDLMMCFELEMDRPLPNPLRFGTAELALRQTLFPGLIFIEVVLS